uniref:Uncharacterized protein n=1 Tax=Zea mays TaxID=4577 RepID=A0A804LNT7_MAIZE
MADVGVAAGLPQDLGLASQTALGFAMPSVAHVSLILASYRNKGQEGPQVACGFAMPNLSKSNLTSTKK